MEPLCLSYAALFRDRIVISTRDPRICNRVSSRSSVLLFALRPSRKQANPVRNSLVCSIFEQAGR
jgi:hypothetical protein